MQYYCTDVPDQTLINDAYGQRQLLRVSQKKGIKYLPIFYCSRAMEWINLQNIFREVLSYYGLLDQVDLESIAFSWSYDRNLATRFYKPSDVFK